MAFGKFASTKKEKKLFVDFEKIKSLVKEFFLKGMDIKLLVLKR